MKLKILIALVFISILLLLGCTQYNANTTTQTSNETPSKSSENSKIKEFEITAKQWEFIPDTITVNKGDKVKLHVKSVDVTHGFALPEFGINETLTQGNTVTIEFIANKSGEFVFSCSVYCGSGHSNMKGKLIVK
jgi:cytochrome c oxidase subunit 2